jgi:hypothetical protein
LNRANFHDVASTVSTRLAEQSAPIRALGTSTTARAAAQRLVHALLDVRHRAAVRL